MTLLLLITSEAGDKVFEPGIFLFRDHQKNLKTSRNKKLLAKKL